MYAAGFLSSISKGQSPMSAASNASILAEEIIKIHGAQFEKLDIKVLKEKIFNYPQHEYTKELVSTQSNIKENNNQKSKN